MVKKKAFEIMQECQEAICNPNLTQTELEEITDKEYEGWGLNMPTTTYYYRIDFRDTSICDRCPKTKEQVDKIKSWKEREHWSRLAGLSDKDIKAYRLHKSELWGLKLWLSNVMQKNVLIGKQTYAVCLSEQPLMSMVNVVIL